MQSKLLTLFRIGVTLAILLTVYESFFTPGDKRQQTTSGINQRQLNITNAGKSDFKIISEELGTLIDHGWALNSERIKINYEDSRCLFPAKLRYKAFNNYQLQLGDILVQLKIQFFYPFCKASILVYGDSLQNKYETVNSSTIRGHCPEIDFHKTELSSKYGDGDIGIDIDLDPKSEAIKFSLQARKLSLNVTVQISRQNYDEQFSVLPVDDVQTNFYASSKSAGLKVSGNYLYKGKNNTCGDKECFASYDIGRGIFCHQTQWYSASLTTVLPGTNEIFSLFFGDGIGTHFNKTLDKAMEDFLMINGKHYKLDITRLENNNLTSKHIFRTIGGIDRIYPKRGCDVKFEPLQGSPIHQGFDFGFYAFKQDILVGNFTGTCHFEQNGPLRVIKFRNVRGVVEHVTARW
ncbi:hypothetical protein FGO68_gene7257 [Halteria grandinella]|uniref:Uncharacterized protein n=1 Tax=Halteria grandinella TaxID=5974 RepID=A0A8J8NMM8_HALGN|nr:hypothetical protein FGO68_gene7257 [Halteria grandinella]